ncbi:MAG: hypothetical protein ACE5I1_18275, partial [bacterium]
MKEHYKLLNQLTFALAMVSTPYLLFNMLVMPIFKQQIFFEREIHSGVEYALIIGFGLVLLFDIVSLLWILLRLPRLKKRIAMKRFYLFSELFV